MPWLLYKGFRDAPGQQSQSSQRGKRGSAQLPHLRLGSTWRRDKSEAVPSLFPFAHSSTRSFAVEVVTFSIAVFNVFVYLRAWVGC